MKPIILTHACVALGIFLGTAAANASGQTEPRIEPEPGFNGNPLLHCKDDPGRTFRYEHQRRAECNDHDKPRDVECSAIWTPGVMLATNEKECA